MKRKAVMLLACALPFAMLAGCAPAGTKGTANYPGTLEDVTVWCVPATEKVLKRADADNYEGTNSIALYAARGEYEAAQIMLTAEESLSYEVKANDLKSGSNTFSAANVDIFHEKYINVTKPFGGKDAGLYPDALVPFENIKDAGENVVPAGENQGLYVRFHVPADQAAGTYTGSITLTVAGKTKEVPVSLEVRNVTISEENHTQSVFLNEWFFYKGELDSTQEMFDKYNEALYEYRLNPNMLLYDFDVDSDEGIAAYVDKAWEYVQEYNVSTISLPYVTERVEGGNIDTDALRIEMDADNPNSDKMYVSDHDQYDFTESAVNSVVYDGFGIFETVDKEVMTKYLEAFSEKSFEEGVDLVSKLVTYYRLIDETRNEMGYKTVKMISLISRNTANAVANAYLVDDGAAIKAKYPDLDKKAKANGYQSADDFIQAVADSLYDLYHIVTIAANTDYEEILPYLEGGCPLFDYYDTEDVREDFYSQTQKWWYGCVAPEPPYATYRIDDSMLSPRMVSWMQAQYGVVGNLFWATDIYAYNSNWTYQEIYDYYSGNAERYPGANGDGFLFYPGAQYGVDGPVASMRLEAIRDGLEEYELLYALQETYNEGMPKDDNGDGVNDYFYSMMEDLTSDLYLGTVVTADEAAFSAAREQLFTLYELAASPASFVLTGQSEDGAGEVTFGFAAAEGASVTLDEGSRGTLQKGTTASGMTSYTVTVDLTAQGDNTLRIKLTKDDKDYVYEQYLGGKVTVNEVTDAVTKDDIKETSRTPSGSTFTKEDNMLQAVLAAPLNTNQRQEFTLQGALIAGIGKEAEKFSMVIDAPQGTTISVYLTGGGREASIGEAKFVTGGVQTFTFSLESVNWDRVGAVQSLRFVVSSTQTGADAQQVTVRIGTVLVYGK